MPNEFLTRGSQIIVTGVSSFIASHIADQLLEDGFNVRGTVRTASKGELLQKYLHSKYGRDRFELAIVEDSTKDRAFDEVFKGIAGICHVATAASFTTNPDDVIPATVAGAVNILRSAAKEPSIQSFVYTSDSFAVLLPETNKPVDITTTTYNEDAVAAAYNPDELGSIKAKSWDANNAVELAIWAAAKVAAEKAVWNFVSSSNPAFQVAAVVPNFNIGPPVGNVPLSSTGTSIPNLLLDKPADLYFPAQYFVNVRDCAKLHVAALLDAEQAGKRIFACAAPFNWNDVLAILRRLRPEADVRVDFRDLGRDLSVLPNEPAEELLRKWYGHGWTGLEESVRENIEGV